MALRAVSNFGSGGGTPVTETTGTFTPTDASGAGLTFAASSGNYHKVGKNVLIWGYVTYPSTASAVQAIIGGLPFASSNTSINGFPSVAAFVVGASTWFVNKNATTMGLGTNGAAVNNVVVSGATVYFSGVYPTDT